MKKTILILFLIVFSLLYYLGFLTKKETLPLSKDFFATESPSSVDQVLDLKGVGIVKSKLLERKALSLSSQELNQLYQLKLDKGISNFSVLSLWLVRESKKAREEGDSSRAIELATYANSFSPDLPHPYFELARTRWRQNPFRPNEILPEIYKGYRAEWSYYPSSLRFYYHLFYILSNAVLMAFIVFGIVLLLKYLPLYFYDIRKNLAQELSTLFFNGLKIFVLFVPFFLRLDILWAILFWSILLWGYVPAKERQFVLVFLVVLVYVPFFLQLSSTVLNGKGSEVIMEMNEANNENWNKGTEERLRAWAVAQPDDSEVLFTLGLIEKRQGRYAQAEELYRRAIQRDPNSSEALSNLGNIYLAQKQIQLAIASYQQAIELNPDNGAYYYNLYRAYSQETFLSPRTDRAFQKARQLSPGLIDYYSMIDSPNMNRLVIDQPLTSSTFWNRFIIQMIGKEGLLFRLFKAWFEKVPGAIPFLAPILFLAYLIGMSRYTRAKRFLTRCPMCGSPTHRFYLKAPDTPDQDFVCFNCHRLFVQKETLHPKITEKKSLQVGRFQKQNHFAGKFLSHFFVGFSDVWKGSTLKGLLLLLLFFIFVLRLIYWKGVLPDPYLRPSSSWWEASVWGIVFIVFYLISIRRVRKQKPEYEILK